MKLVLLLVLFLHCLWLSVMAQQQVVDVIEQTIRLGGNNDEEILLGFAAGDKILFSFQELDGKTVREVEIIEYPNIVKFSEYKTKKVEGKVLSVSNKAVYIFRLKNSGLGKRVCKIKIQRIPISEVTASFNPTVKWITKQETIYRSYTKDVLVGYDTTYIQKKSIELAKTELSEDMIVDKVERVHSIGNIDYKNMTVVQVVLPKNEITTYRVKKIKAWTYWITVGKEGIDAWNKNMSAMQGAFNGVTNVFRGGPLSQLAIGAVSALIMPTLGDDVAYFFITDYDNARLFLAEQPFMQFDNGKGVGAYGKKNNRLNGTFYIGLLNDNKLRGIDANIKVSIIWETQYFEEKVVVEVDVTPRYEKKVFTEPVVKVLKIPVIEN